MGACSSAPISWPVTSSPPKNCPRSCGAPSAPAHESFRIIASGPAGSASDPEDPSAFQAVNSPSTALNKLGYADAEDVFVRVAEQVDAVLTARRNAAASAKGHAHAGSPGEALFADLQMAAIMTSVLIELAAKAPGGTHFTLSQNHAGAQYHLAQAGLRSARTAPARGMDRESADERADRLRDHGRRDPPAAATGRSSRRTPSTRDRRSLIGSTPGCVRRQTVTQPARQQGAGTCVRDRTSIRVPAAL